MADSLFDSILSSLMSHCYHEIAQSYENFLSILPYEKLSINSISEILPPYKGEKSEFWVEIERIVESEMGDRE